MVRQITSRQAAIADLSRIPGVGPSIAADLYLLGMREVSDLRDRNPERLYEELCDRMGHQVDRCVLYTFRAAVYFTTEPTPDPFLLKWWNWKDDRIRSGAAAVKKRNSRPRV